MMRVRPYRTVDNLIDGVVITFVDITQRKAAEEHTALLLAELDDRVKNIPAIVSSVITQTLKNNPTPAVFARAMEGRIAAITRAHRVLTQMGGRDEASPRDLLATELAPYDRGAQSVSITGIHITLMPRAGLSLAMAFHELASNAAKYGALSTNSGSLAVSWTVHHTSGAMLNFMWQENWRTSNRRTALAARVRLDFNRADPLS